MPPGYEAYERRGHFFVYKRPIRKVLVLGLRRQPKGLVLWRGLWRVRECRRVQACVIQRLQAYWLLDGTRFALLQPKSNNFLPQGSVFAQWNLATLQAWLW